MGSDVQSCAGQIVFFFTDWIKPARHQFVVEINSAYKIRPSVGRAPTGGPPHGDNMDWSTFPGPSASELFKNRGGHCGSWFKGWPLISIHWRTTLLRLKMHMYIYWKDVFDEIRDSSGPPRASLMIFCDVHFRRCSPASTSVQQPSSTWTKPAT